VEVLVNSILISEFICLLICGLFNDTVSSDDTALNDRVINEKRTEKDMEVRGQGLIKGLEGLGGGSCQPLGWDLNLGLPV
jgi:hypothetical protein